MGKGKSKGKASVAGFAGSKNTGHTWRPGDALVPLVGFQHPWDSLQEVEPSNNGFHYHNWLFRYDYPCFKPKLGVHRMDQDKIIEHGHLSRTKVAKTGIQNHQTLRN